MSLWVWFSKILTPQPQDKEFFFGADTESFRSFMLQLNWEFEALRSSFSFPTSSSNESFSLLFFGLTKMPGSYSLAKMTYKTKCSCKAESRGVKRRKVPITSGPPAAGACTVPHTTDCEKVLQQKA